MTKAKKRSIKAELVADLADYLDRRKESTEELIDLKGEIKL